jgi:hypothetical protein
MTVGPMAAVADMAASTKSGRVGVIDEVWTIAPFLRRARERRCVSNLAKRRGHVGASSRTY